MKTILPITPILKPYIPSQYEGESFTALELTAKSAAKINEIVEAYNKFVEGVDATIVEFTSGVNKTDELFRMEMAQKFQDFIEVIEIAYDAQNLKISESVEYLRANFKEYVEEQVHNLYESGELEENLLDAVGELSTKFDGAINDIASYKNTMNAEMAAFKSEINNTTNDFIDTVDGQIETMATNAAVAVNNCNDAAAAAMTAVDALNIAFADINGGAPTDTDMADDYNGGLVE